MAGSSRHHLGSFLGGTLTERAAAQFRLLDRRRDVRLVEGADVGAGRDDLIDPVEDIVGKATSTSASRSSSYSMATGTEQRACSRQLSRACLVLAARAENTAIRLHRRLGSVLADHGQTHRLEGSSVPRFTPNTLIPSVPSQKFHAA